VAYASHIQTILPFNIDQVSPLVIHCLYRCGMRSIESAELQNGNANEDLAIVMTTLRKLDKKWRLAGQYLKILNTVNVKSDDGTMDTLSDH